MSRKNERLLERSIEHWLRMRDDSDCKERPTPHFCHLCKEYWDRNPSGPRCRGCPIWTATREDLCWRTPYMAAYMAHRDWLDAKKACAKGDVGPAWPAEKWREWRRTATVELQFLRKVLAAEKRKTAKRKRKVKPSTTGP